MNSILVEPQFRLLDCTGVHTLLDWARNEGWNPGYHDAAIFYQTDPKGFYGFYDGDELIAGGAIISYSSNYGFMGLFIVSPRYRNSGLGRKLWYLRRDQLLARLQSPAIIGMDGVVAMQPFYQKGGFEIAYREERFKIKGRQHAIVAEVVPYNSSLWSEVLAYDAVCFGCMRLTFLKSWLRAFGHHAFVYDTPEGVKGLAVIRKAYDGYKIGPLFADNAAIAESLLQACLHTAAEEHVYLDVPVINQEAMELVQRYDGNYVFECARMYYGGAPAIDTDKIFGVTSFELG
jgi:GNAT superfamily N-acetyltransferase